MNKTCFVIMGFGVKNNINLDLTYNKIIKPCIIENGLIPFPLYEETKFNAYRCDEICGTTSIDYKFVTCLNGADIVIADISTMNANAIYELGARHALKPRSTILLCAKDKEHEFKFFDITYVPIIFYNHNGLKLLNKVIEETKKKLNAMVDFAINSTSTLPDNPIQRALIEGKTYGALKSPIEISNYQLYLQAKTKLDNNEYSGALKDFEKLYIQDPSEENLLLLVLAKYKQAESQKSCKDLIDCINLITNSVHIESSTSEYLFGRLAAISLRVYNLSHDESYFYTALEYYRRGCAFCKTNLYCPRNYCALLVRIQEITDDINIINEYFYTAKHYAKIFLSLDMAASYNGEYDQRIYYYFNRLDLCAIVEGEYMDYEKAIVRLKSDNDISRRQQETILNGMVKLKSDLETITHLIKSY